MPSGISAGTPTGLAQGGSQESAELRGDRRPPARDHAAKLLGLLDFSAATADSEGLVDTLGVLLLSLMGEFGAPGGAILLGDGGSLVVRVAKGPGARAVLGRRFERPAEMAAEPLGSEALSALHPLQPLAEALAAETLVPIRHREAILGLLALSRRVGGGPYAPDEVELVRLVGRLAGTVVANHLLYEELRESNRKLRRGIFDLHTLFDVSRELNVCLEAQSILRIVIQTAMAHVLVSQCALLLAENDAVRVAASRGIHPPPRDGEEVANVEEFRLRAGMQSLVPLKVAATTRGYLAIGARKDGRLPSQEDLEFLATLGHQATTALDNLKLHRDRAVRERLESELLIARQIQTGLFPRSLPVIPGFEVAGFSEPCFEVGGDYYNIFAIPSGVLLAMGDVAGKNIPAALLMSVLQATLKSLGDRGESPTALIRSLNRRLLESTLPGKFASFFLSVLDPPSGRLRYANAGHNPPILLRRDGSVELLTVGGPVLGIFDEHTCEEAEVTLARGDVVFIYTDGVTEAMNASDDELGEAALIETLRRAKGGSAQELNDAVRAAVMAHTAGSPPSDDLTVLTIQRSVELEA